MNSNNMNSNKFTGNNLKMFFKENKSLVVSLPVLAVLIIAAIIYYSAIDGGSAGNAGPSFTETLPSGVQGNQVEVLPQTERANSYIKSDKSGEGVSNTDGIVKNPFNGPVVLTGVVIKDDGDSMAILETGGKTFIVKKEDVLENGMVVKDISFDKVLLTDDGKNIELSLD